MDTYNERPKQYAEQINIWYSKHQQCWMTCAWVVREEDHYFTRETVYKKDRRAHPDFDTAVAFIATNYKEKT